MAGHLEKELEKLKKRILLLSALVEESLHKALRAVSQRDTKLARGVVDGDSAIDEMEVEVEEECLKVLALHQPVAVDLRFIISVLKINRDLERIGDFAVSMADKAARLASYEHRNQVFDFSTMGEKVLSMLSRSIDSMVKADAQLAMDVCAADDEVDRMKRGAYVEVKTRMREHPEEVDYLLDLLSISRHLERIADHATNIAEDVIYSVNGEIVRHRLDEFAP
ncbi:MAG: phosphate transport system regulatory protein PhoU [Planctomycetales bacterium 4484_113]|nr:MAG: phosphate transport system regulatory protein PhoU [Planctomycetales bacterium 4484_113]